MIIAGTPFGASIRRLITRCLACTAGASLAASAPNASPLPAAPLMTAAQVISLPAAEAQRALPARVEGVVIYARLRPEGAIVVQDATRAIYVRPGPDCPSDIKRGDVVVVEGVTDPGRFAPIIHRASCKIVGSAPLPTATPVELAELLNGQFDGQWVEVTGVVRSASRRRNASNDSLVEILQEEVRLPVVFHDVTTQTSEKWIDSKIRVRGICFHFCNPKGQLFYSQIVVPSGETHQLLEPGPPDPFELPVQSPASVLRYEYGGTNEHRIHIRGTVTYSARGQLFVQDGRDGLEVQTRAREVPAIGAVVDVVGFAARGEYSPILEDATFRLAQERAEILPREVNERQIREADGELVRIATKLVEVRWSPTEWILLVQRGGSLFNAYLPLAPDAAKATPPWENGSELALTGVARTIMGSPQLQQWRWEPHSLRLLLRSPADITVLRSAPWWRTSGSKWTGVGVLLAITAALAILSLRSRARVREQKNQRRAAEAEFTAVFNERSRVAREIHDTLAQGLTSISMQIEMTKEQLTTRPAAALTHLEIARNLVRGSLMEARRSIWGLKPQILETNSLSAAIREIGQQLVLGSGIAFQLTVTGEELRLSADSEVDILRIGQEAITNAVKHAKPSMISVELTFVHGSVQLRVTDDGTGYEVGAPVLPRVDRTGFGVIGMHERVQQIKGTLTVKSFPEKGTELIVNVPTD